MLCFLASGRGSEVWRRECDKSTRSALLARRGKNELRVGITRYYTNIDEVGEVVANMHGHVHVCGPVLLLPVWKADPP